MQAQIKEIKYIDLFCGLGAFHTAFNRSNLIQNKIKYTCVLASDINEKVRKVYEENYGMKPEGDINSINIDSIPDFEILCAGFPCFVKGTKVLTYVGYKNIENVDLTDRLMTHTGKFQKILNLQHKNYNGNLYEITAKYHPSIKCTDEHPFYIRERTQTWNNKLQKYKFIYKEPRWKKANELTKNDYFGMKINENSIIPEFRFETEVVKIKLDNPDMWFMMGYFVSNGSLEEKNNKYKIIFSNTHTKNESDIFDRINNILKLTGEKTDKKEKKFSCENYLWFDILNKFCNSQEKQIPEWVQDAPNDCIQQFIDGYNESVNKAVLYNFAFGIQRLYLKLGYFISIRKHNCSTVKDLYYIDIENVNKENNSIFIENGYAWYAPLKIKSVYIENEIVYNFEVDNDNSYIVENIICHNCQPFSIAGNQKGFQDEKSGNLFYKILEIIDTKKPKTLMLENVKNLHTIHKGDTFKIIKKELENRGYNVSYKIIDSRYYNSPQSRQRIYIICDKDSPYVFREINNPIVPVSTILDNSITEFFNYDQKYRLDECNGGNMMKYKLINKETGKGGRQGERVYDITKCGPTICASSGGPGAKTGLYDFNGKIRTLSIKETLKMFGFDETYKYNSLTNKKDMLFYLGNSIVVNVLEELIKDL